MSSAQQSLSLPCRQIARSRQIRSPILRQNYDACTRARVMRTMGTVGTRTGAPRRRWKRCALSCALCAILCISTAFWASPMLRGEGRPSWMRCIRCALWTATNDTTPGHRTSTFAEDTRTGWGRCRHPPCSREAGCGLKGALVGVDGTRCCADVLEELLVALQDFAEERGVLFHIGFGTLLGAYRGNEIIPWTSDVDVVVEPGALEVLTEISDWNPRYYFWVQSKDIGRMCIVDYESPGTDVWQKASTKAVDSVYADIYVPRHYTVWGVPKTWYKAVPQCVFDTVDIYGTSAFGDRVSNSSFTRLAIGNRTFPAPSNPENVLSLTYGSQWRTPLKSRASHGAGWCSR